MCDDFFKIKNKDLEAAWGAKLTMEEMISLKNICFITHEGKHDEFYKLLKSRAGILKILIKIYDEYNKESTERGAKAWDANVLLELLKRCGSTGLAYSKLFDKNEQITADDKMEIIDGILMLEPY